MESEIRTVKGRITQIIPPEKAKDHFVFDGDFFKNRHTVVVTPSDMPKYWLKRVWVYYKYWWMDMYYSFLIDVLHRNGVYRPEDPCKLSIIVMHNCTSKVGDTVELQCKPVYKMTDYLVVSSDIDNIMV